MPFSTIYSFDNYIDAQLCLQQLQNENINCWLKDEHTVTIDPLLTNAIGGIKLMVHETQKDRATDLLRTILNKAKENRACPYCGSFNVEYIFSNRKASNWFSAIFTYLLGGYALASEKMYHCFDCKKEFSEIPDKPSEKANTDISS